MSQELAGAQSRHQHRVGAPAWTGGPTPASASRPGPTTSRSPARCRSRRASAICSAGPRRDRFRIPVPRPYGADCTRRTAPRSGRACRPRLRRAHRVTPARRRAPSRSWCPRPPRCSRPRCHRSRCPGGGAVTMTADQANRARAPARCMTAKLRRDALRLAVFLAGLPARRVRAVRGLRAVCASARRPTTIEPSSPT